ncbi:F-box domain-containing protein [Mycena sanguinolenta]|uniref:F-box domain-containing protein n=1 Tax=Mycena sanguinolenta TaxID=230812 RepID=A0A8H6YU73_9AGAR|nr:F-box domain-containing protein [Mycena sanguinolenta]
MLGHLEADRARVAELEARILDLECSIAELRAEKAIAQERLNSYKYQVLTLPDEIISEIFVHFLPSYPICPPLVGPLSPISLTHICRKWRARALATPVLWRAIDFCYSYDFDIPNSDQCSTFQIGDDCQPFELRAIDLPQLRSVKVSDDPVARLGAVDFLDVMGRDARRGDSDSASSAKTRRLLCLEFLDCQSQLFPFVMVDHVNIPYLVH